MSDSFVARHGRLILVPAVITLVVTLVRLIGELQNWSPTLFNKSAGGGGAPVGIVWLVPIFGIYFALKLSRDGEGPERVGRAIGRVFLAFLIVPAVLFVVSKLNVDPNGMVPFVSVVAAATAGAAVAYKAWPRLWRVQLAYGVAARIPVVIVMLVAILGDWGTHYDVPPNAEFPQMAPLAKWFWIGVLPQMTVWIAFTVVVGMLCGLIAVAIAHRGRVQQPA